MDTFRIFVNKLFFKKSFNIIFMENVKSCHKSQLFFSFFLFFYKKYLKIFFKPIPLRHLLNNWY